EPQVGQLSLGAGRGRQRGGERDPGATSATRIETGERETRGDERRLPRVEDDPPDLVGGHGVAREREAPALSRLRGWRRAGRNRRGGGRNRRGGGRNRRGGRMRRGRRRGGRRRVGGTGHVC